MSKKGQSIGRQQRRGKADQFGRPLRKRPFNNSKRTKGRKMQADIHDRYHIIKDRLAFIKSVAKVMKQHRVKIGDANWKKEFRKYSDSNIMLDDIEKEILFQIVTGRSE